MSTVATVDWGIIAVISVSTLISIQRGFVKEALSLVTLVAAMIISRLFGSQFSTLLIDVIEVASLRNVVAYIGLFFLTLVVGGLINKLVVQVVRMAGLSGTDRFFGMLFGCARGVLVTVVVVAILARLGMAEDQWWQDSRLIPHFVALGDWLQMLGWEDANNLMQQV
ncbi:MAG: membrane protein required for colicin V production [Candidatus Azotimanducaceae bacterium]